MRSSHWEWWPCQWGVHTGNDGHDNEFTLGMMATSMRSSHWEWRPRQWGVHTGNDGHDNEFTLGMTATSMRSSHWEWWPRQWGVDWPFLHFSEFACFHHLIYRTLGRRRRYCAHRKKRDSRKIRERILAKVFTNFQNWSIFANFFKANYENNRNERRKHTAMYPYHFVSNQSLRSPFIHSYTANYENCCFVPGSDPSEP